MLSGLAELSCLLYPLNAVQVGLNGENLQKNELLLGMKSNVRSIVFTCMDNLV